MQTPAGREEARQFLEALFPEVPAGLAICVWQDKPKASYWLKDAERAAVIATFEPQTANMYFGCCLGEIGRAKEQRLRADEARAMPGLWMDFDYGPTGHEKKNLPPDQDAVMDLLSATPFRPSVLVHTGGGIHAYWLFHELIVFESPAQRDAALQLNQRMQAAFRYKAKARGWDQDSTFNLDRVLRVPGTKNIKSEPHRPCRVLELNDYRYNPSDIDDFLDAHVAVTELARVYTPEAADWQGVVLAQDATISMEMLQEMMRIDPRFQATWERRRSDLSDQSMSGYDMALANFAAMASMTRQQAVDLMMAFRQKHGCRKPRTLQYFQRTIDWAFGGKTKDERIARKGLLPTQNSRPQQSSAVLPGAAAVASADHAADGHAAGGAPTAPHPPAAEQDQAQPDAPAATGAPAVPAAEEAGGGAFTSFHPPPAAISQDQPSGVSCAPTAAEAPAGGKGGGGGQAPPPPPRNPPNDEEMKRGRALTELQDLFGFEVKRFVQLGKANGVFHMHTAKGIVNIGTSKDLLSMAAFRAAAVEITGVQVTLSAKNFGTAINLLLSIKEEEELDMDSSPIGQIQMLLQQYLRSVSIFSSWEAARQSDNPLGPHVDMGALWINATNMGIWGQTQRLAIPEGRVVASRLRELGAMHKTKAIKSKKTSFSFWRLPVDKFDPEDFKVSKVEDVFYGAADEQRERIQ